MEQYRVNYNFLDVLAREDFQLNGWIDMAFRWMLDYEGYFEDEENALDEAIEEEEEEEGEVGDEEEDGPVDEGIGDEIPSIRVGALQAGYVFYRKVSFCEVTSAVQVTTARRKYWLCSRCYIYYTDLYSARNVEHEHIMYHVEINADRVLRTNTEKCSCCRLPLTQRVLTGVCLICNN